MVNRIEYIENSRIDGYPFYKIPKNIEGKLFIDCIENMRNNFNEKIKYLNHLEDNTDNIIIKIFEDKDEIEKKLKMFRVSLRREKIKKLNEK